MQQYKEKNAVAILTFNRSDGDNENYKTTQIVCNN